jgi:hypothetical protein
MSERWKITLRGSASLFLVTWMLAGPILFGTGTMKVQLYQRTADGDVPVDRLEVLGHDHWRHARTDRLLGSRRELDSQLARICRALGTNVDLRGDVDVGRVHGWVALMRREEDLCRR